MQNLFLNNILVMAVIINNKQRKRKTSQMMEKLRQIRSHYYTIY